MAQFSLYVHKGGLKPDSSHFCYNARVRYIAIQPKPLLDGPQYTRFPVHPLSATEVILTLMLLEPHMC